VRPATSLLIAGILLFSFCQQALADQISLRNGDRLTGQVVKSDGKTIAIKTAYAGVVTVSLDAVAEITSDQPLYLSTSDGKTVAGTLAVKAGSVEVATKDSGKVALPRDLVQAIRSQAEHDAHLAEAARYRDAGPFDLWGGSIETGFSLSSGNSDTKTFSLGANADRVSKRDKTSAYFSSLYTRNSSTGVGQTTARTVRTGGRYERSLSDRISSFGSLDLEHSGPQGLDMRAVSGAGLGWYAKKGGKAELQLFGGGSYNREYFTTGLTRNSGELLLGKELSYRASDRLSFKERFVLYPSFKDGGYVRAAFDSSVATKLTRRFDWYVNVSNRFLSNPLPGTERNDLLLTTGLRANFRD
jgi:hypothetical protein